MDSNEKPKKQSEPKSTDDEKLHHIIQSFMSDRDVAPWYRGTSIFHLRGSNELFNAIRDDMEQKTTHRVRNCLNLIGLDPMIAAKDIALLMRLSKGSDLAFLWFLLEMRYKIPDSADVGLNEQLICSAIAHLDMVTTLRGLDKILPACQQPQRKKNKKKMKLPQTERQTYSPKYVMPYFEKQRRPKMYGEPLTIPLPKFEVDFYHYVSYKDKNHKVSNESNRWFADYDFHPGRRVAYDVMRNAISEIFHNVEAANVKGKTIDVLCNHHRAIKKLEDNAKLEVQVQIRDKCLKKYFGTAPEKRKYRRRCTIESLYTAIEKQLCDFHKMTTKPRRDFTLKTVTSDCNITDVMIGSEYDQCCRTLCCLNENKSGVPQGTIKSGAGDAAPANNIVKFDREATGDSVNNQPDVGQAKNLKATHVNPPNTRTSKPCHSVSQMSMFASKYLKTLDYGHRGETPSPSQTFFHASRKHQPLLFDYRKIFLFKEDGKSDKCINSFQEEFLAALDKDISTLTEVEVAQTDVHLAASECASNIWRAELASYKPVEESLGAIQADPEDKNLMDKMLADAFEELRKDPKYVLAQLPDAHKLPILREWICRRYGKVYTPKQRIDSYRRSFQVFQALDRMSFDVPTPTANSLGTNLFMPYTCRDYLATKIKGVGSKFYQHLDNAIMEQSRNYWFAMRGHLISSGPPLQTFFGYMPSRIRDIQHFRLWKNNEHRLDRAAWDKRWLIQRRQRSRM